MYLKDLRNQQYSIKQIIDMSKIMDDYINTHNLRRGSTTCGVVRGSGEQF